MSSAGVLFVYHRDNRCEGSTDGRINLKPAAAVDEPFTIDVTTDGKGWMEECKKKAGKYSNKFNLKKEIQGWSADASAPQYDQGSMTLLLGNIQYGVKFFFKKENGNFYIYKIEYSDEDPG
jgi:hypothetical protein